MSSQETQVWTKYFSQILKHLFRWMPVKNFPKTSKHIFSNMSIYHKAEKFHSIIPFLRLSTREDNYIHLNKTLKWKARHSILSASKPSNQIMFFKESTTKKLQLLQFICKSRKLCTQNGHLQEKTNVRSGLFSLRCWAMTFYTGKSK